MARSFSHVPRICFDWASAVTPRKDYVLGTVARLTAALVTCSAMVTGGRTTEGNSKPLLRRAAVDMRDAMGFRREDRM